MFLHLGAGGGAPWQPWFDSGRHGSLSFHGMGCVLCVVYVRYVNWDQSQFLTLVDWSDSQNYC